MRHDEMTRRWRQLAELEARAQQALAGQAQAQEPVQTQAPSTSLGATPKARPTAEAAAAVFDPKAAAPVRASKAVAPVRVPKAKPAAPVFLERTPPSSPAEVLDAPQEQAGDIGMAQPQMPGPQRDTHSHDFEITMLIYTILQRSCHVIAILIFTP